MNGLISGAMEYGSRSSKREINLGGAAYTPNRIERLSSYFDRNIVSKIITSDERFEINLTHYSLKPEIESELTNYKFHEIYKVFGVYPQTVSYNYTGNQYTGGFQKIYQKYMTPCESNFVVAPSLCIEAIDNNTNSSTVLSSYGNGDLRIRCDWGNLQLLNSERDSLMAVFYPKGLQIIKANPAELMSLNFNTDLIVGGLPVIEAKVESGNATYTTTSYDTGYSVSNSKNGVLIGDLNVVSYEKNLPNVVRYNLFETQYPLNLSYASYNRLWIYSDINPNSFGSFLEAMWKSIFKSVGFFDAKLLMEG